MSPGLTGEPVDDDDVPDGHLLLTAASTDDRVHLGTRSLVDPDVARRTAGPATDKGRRRAGHATRRHVTDAPRVQAYPRAPARVKPAGHRPPPADRCAAAAAGAAAAADAALGAGTPHQLATPQRRVPQLACVSCRRPSRAGDGPPRRRSPAAGCARAASRRRGRGPSRFAAGSPRPLPRRRRRPAAVGAAAAASSRPRWCRPPLPPPLLPLPPRGAPRRRWCRRVPEPPPRPCRRPCRPVRALALLDRLVVDDDPAAAAVLARLAEDLEQALSRPACGSSAPARARSPRRPGAWCGPGPGTPAAAAARGRGCDSSTMSMKSTTMIPPMSRSRSWRTISSAASRLFLVTVSSRLPPAPVNLPVLTSTTVIASVRSMTSEPPDGSHTLRSSALASCSSTRYAAKTSPSPSQRSSRVDQVGRDVPDVGLQRVPGLVAGDDQLARSPR